MHYNNSTSTFVHYFFTSCHMKRESHLNDQRFLITHQRAQKLQQGFSRRIIDCFRYYLRRYWNIPLVCTERDLKA